MAEPEGFRHFVMARSPALVRSAWLLTGDLATAEDLVQTVLGKVWSRWAHVTRQDAPEAYVRRVMMSTFLTWKRRRWNGELAFGELPDSPSPRNDLHEVELRASVAQALRDLPPRQRAVVVLRHFDDLTEAQVAEALRCSVGTVKSQNAKALKQLRTNPHLAALAARFVVSTEETASDTS